MERAERLNAVAMDLDEKGWFREAELKYLEAAEADPCWAAPLFNLGLLAKRERRWKESLEFNLRAIEREERHEGALWNAGIAATALSDWVNARKAWRACGVQVPDGVGPIDLDLGVVPIRTAGQEVVWCRRVDPARAVILSVPFAESERRFQDVLLHDGAPNGSRWYGGKEVPVFDELEVLQESSFVAYSIRAKVRGPADVQALAELAGEAGLAAEDWTTVKVLCKACSEGLPHKHHLEEATPWKSERHLAIAAREDAEVDAVLDRWMAHTGAETLAPED